MTYRALIPVKSLAQAKSRLATTLSQGQRAELVLTMLEHVVHVLKTIETLGSIAIVSPDATVLQQALRWGIQAYPEEQKGHNPALEAAARRELRAGTSGLLTISADLPFIDANEIETMLELSQRYQVVLAASQEGTGTNAMLLQPPLALPYLFGPGSLQRYESAARERHLRVIRYTSTGTALDIDTQQDLKRFWHWHYAEQPLQTTPMPQSI